MKQIISFLFLSLLYCSNLCAEDIMGTICDETNKPIEGVNASLRTSRGGKMVSATMTTDKGSFVLRNVETGKYTLRCSRMGYSQYTADVQVAKGQDLVLETLIMFTESVEINEVVVSACRNVFTTDKQPIYPSDQQAETSSGGLDLSQKLPIPLLNVNPITRTVSSLDPTGRVALFINDIPADANDVLILDPKQIKRVEVIRNPSTKYGSNLAIALNIIMKQVQDGVALGVNTNNSTKLTYGYNNVFATYNRKNSLLTINQRENYLNYFEQTSDDMRE